MPGHLLRRRNYATALVQLCSFGASDSSRCPKTVSVRSSPLDWGRCLKMKCPLVFKWTLVEGSYAALEDSVWIWAAMFQGNISWIRLIGCSAIVASTVRR